MKLLATLILGIPVCLIIGAIVCSSFREEWEEQYPEEPVEILGTLVAVILYLFWLAGTLYYFS